MGLKTEDRERTRGRGGGDGAAGGEGWWFTEKERKSYKCNFNFFVAIFSNFGTTNVNLALELCMSC